MDKIVDRITNFIDFVDAKYVDINEEWRAINENIGINFRRKNVKDVVFHLKEGEYQINSSFFIETKKYQNFLSEKFLKGELDQEIENPFSDNFTPALIRTKSHNSIISKVLTYRKRRKEEGAVPINKCLNDLLGYRIIIPIEYINFDINDLVHNIQLYCDNKCSTRCKVRNSSKPAGSGVYKALHINLDKDNYSFPWEVQIWAKQDSESNYLLHEVHKQDYIQWEMSLSNTTIENSAIID